MRFFWGRISLSLLGAFGGLPGIAFGFLVGYLADLLLTDYQVKREAKLFLVNATDHIRWVAPIPLLIAGLVVGGTSGDPVTATALITAIRSALRPGRWRRSVLEPVVDVALQLGDSIDRDHLLAYARGHLGDADRATIIALYSVFARADSELRQTAGDLNVDAAVLAELLRTRHRDPAACMVLGVDENASIDEIKRAYRMLASQFHPDTAAGLSAEQQEASATAFVKIREAYERLIGVSEAAEE